MASPRGLESMWVSLMSFQPVSQLKRARSWVEAVLKMGALDSHCPLGDGTNVPLTSWPRACTGLRVFDVPNASRIVATRSSATALSSGLSGIGMFAVQKG